VNIPPHLEIGPNFARFSPSGDVSLVEAVQLITEAIAFCRIRAIRRLLVDSTGLTGFASPSLVDRFWMAQDWAQESKGMVIVAMIARAEHIHPRKFGVMAAADAGLVGDVFTSELEAREWLLSK
jgi:hypothetical protein